MHEGQLVKKPNHTMEVEKRHYQPEGNDWQNVCTWDVGVTIDGKQDAKSDAREEKPEGDYDNETHEAMFERATIRAFAEAAQKAGVRVGETILNVLNNVIYRVLSTDTTLQFIAEGGSDESAQLLIVERLP